MSVLRRTFLYLSRKKGKALILFGVFTVIILLELLCVSVGNAASVSLQNLRETMGGYFKIGTDFEKGCNRQADDSLVQSVMESGGIKAYNGMDISYLLAEDIELMPGRFTGEGDPKARLARFLGNTDSSLNEYFVLGYYMLTEGRHITVEDTGKALISEALAKKNGLSVGDIFSVRMGNENLEKDMTEKISSHSLEIAGIYHIENSQIASMGIAAECDMEENFIFTDTAFLREIKEEILGRKVTVYTDGAAFFVKDPKELDEIAARLPQISGYDWEGYYITKNNKTYEESAAPLERLSGFMQIITWVIMVISALLLSLILFLWMRDRAYETGIYLSIGITKSEIIGQHLLENLGTALAAFLVGLLTAQVLFGRIEQAIGDIVLRIGNRELLEIAGMVLFLVAFSNGVASVHILKQKPGEILSDIN